MVDTLTQVVLPLFLALTMFSLGLTLTVADFARVVTYKKPVLIGVVSLVLITPLAGFLLISLFRLEPALAMGMMLVVTCPGGMFSNLFTSFGKGNLALSISLTAVVSVIYIFTAPVITSLLSYYYFGQGVAVALPFSSIAVPLFLLTLLPVSCGMLIHSKFPRLADGICIPVRNSATVLVALIFILLMVAQGDDFLRNLTLIIVPMVVLNLVMLAVAVAFTTGTGIRGGNKTAVVVEHCIRQEGAAIFIAMGLIGSEQMTVPLLINSTVGIVVCSLFLLLQKGVRSRQRNLLLSK